MQPTDHLLRITVLELLHFDLFLLNSDTTRSLCHTLTLTHGSMHKARETLKRILMQIISRQNSISHLKLKPFAAHNCSGIDSRKWRGGHHGVYSPSLSCACFLFSSVMNFCGCVRKKINKKTGAAPGKKRNRGGKALLTPSLRLQAREVVVGGWVGWAGVSSECLAESAVKLQMCHGGGEEAEAGGGC